MSCMGLQNFHRNRWICTQKPILGLSSRLLFHLLLIRHDDVVGFGISMPSLTKALQKSNGKLFPFGFIHLLLAMHKNDTIDMYLNGVRPDYHAKGVNALYYNEMHKAYIKNNIKKAITNPQLEDNAKALTIWKNFNGRQHLKRRCWILHFD